MISITFDYSSEDDCNRIRELLNPSKPITTAGLDPLGLTSMVKLELLAAGYSTIESIENASDADLCRVNLIGYWRVHQIRELIKFYQSKT